LAAVFASGKTMERYQMTGKYDFLLKIAFKGYVPMSCEGTSPLRKMKYSWQICVNGTVKIRETFLLQHCLLTGRSRARTK
jgi:hypothetical protein